MNDLESHLSDQDRFGLKFLDETLQSYLKIIVLLYADDTVLYAENENELQDLLNEFQNYCNIWKLVINTEKNKIVILAIELEGTIRY